MNPLLKSTLQGTLCCTAVNSIVTLVASKSVPITVAVFAASAIVSFAALGILNASNDHNDLSEH